MPGKSSAQALAEFFQNVLPTVRRDVEEQGRETVHAVVWLVGLASALLTLLAVNDRALAPLRPTARVVLIGSLVAVVALGVLHRIVYHLFEIKQRAHLYPLQGFLAGYLLDTTQPTPPAEWWTRDHVIAHFKEGFGLDYTFLATYDVPDAKCREIYKQQHDIWRVFDDEQLSAMKTDVASYLDMSSEQMFGGLSKEETRRRAKAVGRLRKAAAILFWTTASAFLVAVALLAKAVAAHAPPLCVS